MKLKMAVLVGILLPVIAVAAGDSAATDKKYGERIKQILNKAGIDFNGEFRSEYFNADLGGASVKPDRRTVETNEYSSVDFDILARPNSAVSGRLVFRMHQNWQNLMSGFNNPIFSRWISMDAALPKVLSFHAGDFRALYSPLTLYAPEPQMLFEPEILRQLRREAMNEEFLGDNQRPLQGVTISAETGSLSFIDQLSANACGARLRSVEVNITNGNKAVNSYEKSSDFSKLVFAATVDALMLKTVKIGSSFLYLHDNKASSKLPELQRDVAAQSTAIYDGRAQWDIAPWCALRQGALNLFGEAAVSFDDTAWFEGGDVDSLRRTRIRGNAGFGGIALQAPVIGNFTMNLEAKYIANASTYRNEMAQSPVFLGEQIMNIENDISENSKIFTARHYSTFDALYHHVFKFCPSKETNFWAKAPFTKNSYSRTVYTQKELDSIAQTGLDPSLQLIMPFGPATPNRQGFSADLAVHSADSGIQIQAMMNLLSERKCGLFQQSGRAAKFFQAGGGACVDLSRSIGGISPLELSLSMVRTRADAQTEYAMISDVTNAAASWQCLEKVALLSGVQFIDNSFKLRETRLYQQQTHWSVGVQWQVAPGAHVTGSLGRIIVNGSDSLSGISGPQQSSGGKFAQFLLDASFRAYF